MIYDQTIRDAEINNYPKIAQDFGSYSRRGKDCILKYSTFTATRKTSQKTSKVGELFVSASLKYHNHSKVFYSLLARCQSDWRKRKETLDKFRLYSAVHKLVQQLSQDQNRKIPTTRASLGTSIRLVKHTSIFFPEQCIQEVPELRQ